jgi:hypothetical protein
VADGAAHAVSDEAAARAHGVWPTTRCARAVQGDSHRVELM